LVRRNSGGFRDYGYVDCAWVEFIKCMRESGLPIEALIEYADLYVNETRRSACERSYSSSSAISFGIA